MIGKQSDTVKHNTKKRIFLRRRDKIPTCIIEQNFILIILILVNNSLHINHYLRHISSLYIQISCHRSCIIRNFILILYMDEKCFFIIAKPLLLFKKMRRIESSILIWCSPNGSASCDVICQN